MTSGGVRNIPRIKQLTITYGLFLAKLSGEVIPVQISKKIKTGISKAMAKAKKMERIKSRQLEISVITLTPSGVTEVKKPKTSGNTKKQANKMPK